MKIVLNKDEMVFMKRFIGRYADVVANTLLTVDKEYWLELEGKTQEELADMILVDMKLSLPGFIVVDKSEEELTIDMHPQLSVAYIDFVNRSMDAVKPYTDEIIGLTGKHKDSLLDVGNKFMSIREAINRPLINKVIGFISSKLGIKEFVDESMEVFDRMISDKAVLDQMHYLCTELGCKVNSLEERIKNY